jgi:hypothetical protein
MPSAGCISWTLAFRLIDQDGMDGSMWLSECSAVPNPSKGGHRAAGQEDHLCLEKAILLPAGNMVPICSFY